eukprot:11704611-Alexandrium_andersonii.AAC.1
MPELDQLPARLVLDSEKGLQMLTGLMGRAGAELGWSASGSVKLNERGGERSRAAHAGAVPGAR